jgi:hypothetical protein
MMTTFSRRAVLADAAPTVPASAALALPTPAEPDPIFAVIAEHRRAYVAFLTAAERVSNIDDNSPEYDAAYDDEIEADDVLPIGRPRSKPPSSKTRSAIRNSSAGWSPGRRIDAADVSRGISGTQLEVGCPSLIIMALVFKTKQTRPTQVVTVKHHPQ